MFLDASAGDANCTFGSVHISTRRLIDLLVCSIMSLAAVTRSPTACVAFSKILTGAGSGASIYTTSIASSHTAQDSCASCWASRKRRPSRLRNSLCAWAEALNSLAYFAQGEIRRNTIALAPIAEDRDTSTILYVLGSYLRRILVRSPVHLLSTNLVCKSHHILPLLF